MANIDLQDLINQVLGMVKERHKKNLETIDTENEIRRDNQFLKSYESPYSTTALDRAAKTDALNITEKGALARQQLIKDEGMGANETHIQAAELGRLGQVEAAKIKGASDIETAKTHGEYGVGVTQSKFRSPEEEIVVKRFSDPLSKLEEYPAARKALGLDRIDPSSSTTPGPVGVDNVGETPKKKRSLFGDLFSGRMGADLYDVTHISEPSSSTSNNTGFKLIGRRDRKVLDDIDNSQFGRSVRKTFGY